MTGRGRAGLWAALVAAMLLGGCGGRMRPVPGAAAAPGAGLVAGTWIPVDGPDDRDRTACAGDVGIRFHADGRYEMLEEAGRWRIDGDRLTMAPRGGKAEVTRLRRVGATIMLTYADGHRETLARCP